MKDKWNEMTTCQKAWLIAECIAAVLVIVLIVFDMTGTWKNQLHLYIAAAFLLGEGVQNWNTKRKMAIVDLVFAAILLANAIFLK